MDALQIQASYAELWCYFLSGVTLMKEFQAEYMKYENQRQELTNAEKLFDLSITLYPGLVEVDKELKNMAKVYDLYEAQRVWPPLIRSSCGLYFHCLLYPL